MDFKFNKIRGLDEWNVQLNGSEVAKISITKVLGKEMKCLFINNKNIAPVKGQADAKAILSDFIVSAKNDISANKELIARIKKDIVRLDSPYSINLLQKEIKRLNKEIDNLQSYGLSQCS